MASRNSDPGDEGVASGTMSKGMVVERIQYKGFVNCDHATRIPNEFTVHGIHDIFTSKKEMKKAQENNPLAGRGFKKVVAFMGFHDGFRLDILSGSTESALLQTTAKKVLFAQAVDRYVYIVVKRGQKEGRYACHCMLAEAKKKTTPATIVDFVTRLVEGYIQPEDGGGDSKAATLAPGAALGFGGKRMMSVHDNEEAARIRKTSAGQLLLEGDAAAAGQEGYLDGVAPAANGGTILEDYLEGDDADAGTDNLKISDQAKTREMLSDSQAVKDNAPVGLEAKPWYHGGIDRYLAEERLKAQTPGTFLIRVSSDKKGYSLSLVNRKNNVQHFKIIPKPGGCWAINGHGNAYSSISGLVMHYSAHDITIEGDRCGEPCYAE